MDDKTYRKSNSDGLFFLHLSVYMETLTSGSPVPQQLDQEQMDLRPHQPGLLEANAHQTWSQAFVCFKKPSLSL